MSKPSEALRALREVAGRLPSDQPLTWWDIYDALGDAIADQEVHEAMEDDE